MVSLGRDRRAGAERGGEIVLGAEYDTRKAVTLQGATPRFGRPAGSTVLRSRRYSLSANLEGSDEMERAAMLDRIRQGGRWDLVVIGGGATGLGAALDGATR